MDYLTKQDAITELKKWESLNTEDTAYYLHLAIKTLNRKRFSKLVDRKLYVNMTNKELISEDKKEIRLKELTNLVNNIIEAATNNTRRGYDQRELTKYYLNLIINL